MGPFILLFFYFFFRKPSLNNSWGPVTSDGLETMEYYQIDPRTHGMRQGYRVVDRTGVNKVDFERKHAQKCLDFAYFDWELSSEYS